MGKGAFRAQEEAVRAKIGSLSANERSLRAEHTELAARVEELKRQLNVSAPSDEFGAHDVPQVKAPESLSDTALDELQRYAAALEDSAASLTQSMRKLRDARSKLQRERKKKHARKPARKPRVQNLRPKPASPKDALKLTSATEALRGVVLGFALASEPLIAVLHGGQYVHAEAIGLTVVRLLFLYLLAILAPARVSTRPDSATRRITFLLGVFAAVCFEGMAVVASLRG